MSSGWIELIRDLGLRPVLVDVGASEGHPGIWAPMARESVYVAFDPDLRLFGETPSPHFHKAYAVNQAVTRAGAGDSVEVYLTDSPMCSSTLEPDLESLRSYAFWERFVVRDRVRVAATTLEAALDRLSVDRVDWIKIDTQGTDLGVLQSLGARRLRTLIAADLEPGLIPAYRGEESFEVVQAAMVAQGFWLSRMDVWGVPRVDAGTRDEIRRELPGVDSDLLAVSARAPGWTELRYLRRVESLRAMGTSAEGWVLAWLFAMLDGHPAFALEVVRALPAGCLPDGMAARMRSMSLATMRASVSPSSGWLRPVRRVVRGLARRLGIALR